MIGIVAGLLGSVLGVVNLILFLRKETRTNLLLGAGLRARIRDTDRELDERQKKWWSEKETLKRQSSEERDKPSIPGGGFLELASPQFAADKITSITQKYERLNRECDSAYERDKRKLEQDRHALMEQLEILGLPIEKPKREVGSA